MSILFCLSVVFLTAIAVPEGQKAFIGYWGSAGNKTQLAQLPEALNRGYNVICLAFANSIKANGSFEIQTTLDSIPTKTSISTAAGTTDSSWHYLLSFGGQRHSAGPDITDLDAFVKGFLSTYEAAKLDYGFDGIDIYIEAGMTTPLVRALREVFTTLHAEGQVISLAPEPLDIDPGEVPAYMEGSWNCYVPLIDTTILDIVTYISIQLYNNPMPYNDLVSYINSMQERLPIVFDGKTLFVDIPSTKLSFGFPAADGATEYGPAKPWCATGAKVRRHYQNDSALLDTGGVMTWSIDWDAANDWDWITNVMRIWNEDHQKSVD